MVSKCLGNVAAGCTSAVTGTENNSKWKPVCCRHGKIAPAVVPKLSLVEPVVLLQAWVLHRL